MSTLGHRWLALTLGGVTALAFALRLYHLDFQSFWSDEIFSLELAAPTLVDSLGRVARDVHPPLYFLALHIWVSLFGTSEFSVRLLSALPSALVIPLLFRLGCRLLDVRTGLVAAAICAVSMFQIYYAQEARSYALMTLLAVLSMDAFTQWDAKRRAVLPSRGSWLYYVAATSALLYTHYFGIFVLAVQNLWLIGSWLVARRQTGTFARPTGRVAGSFSGLGAWLGAQLALVVLLLAWLPVLVGQMDLAAGGFWIEQPTENALVRTLMISLSLQPPPWGWPLAWTPWPSLLRNVALLAAVFATLAYFLGATGQSGSRGGSREGGEAGAGGSGAGISTLASCSLLGLWLALPALSALALSAFSINVYTHRNLIASSPALFLLIGAVVTRLPGRVLPAILLAAALVPSATLYPWYYGEAHKTQWREMAAWLGERAEPGDGFVFDAPVIRRNYDFYRGASDYHFVDMRALSRQGRKSQRRRIWLVRALQAKGEHRIQEIVEAWGYGAGSPQRFKDIEVFLYERR